MKATMNRAHIEGLLYNHSLEVKVTGERSKNPGTQFITGSIEIATDDAMLNIVSVHFTYITALTSSGKQDIRFATLSNIINGTYGTVMGVGAENAVKVSVDSAIGLNDFYSDRSGNVELVSAKRNEGGFVHVVPTLKDDELQRNTTRLDVVIYGTAMIEGDPERNTQDKMILKCYGFDFRGAILPMELSVLKPQAMAYFEGLDASVNEPVFTQVYVTQISQTGTRTIETESAWGETIVTEVPTSHKDFVVYNANKEPYEFGTNETITKTEIKAKLAEREVMLADVKQRWEEYRNSNTAIPAATPAAAPKAAQTGFNF